jgi:translation initiation factor 5
MSTLNINRNVADLYYRYKMPRLCVKIKGKGNGIKTVIVNMTEVAKALNRPPTYITKYFGYELGAITQFDCECFIVNGLHEANKLQDLLDGFIRKYVLCPKCDNPETDLTIPSKKEISQSCKACGYHSLLKVEHKLNNFILKNPPNLKPSPQMGNGDNSKDKEFKTSKIVSSDNDVQWSSYVTEEAVRCRIQDLSESVKKLIIFNEKTEKERLDIFYEYVKKRRDECELDSIQAHKDLYSEARRLDVILKAPLILAELLLSDNITLDIKKHRNLFLRFTHDDERAQKYLLGGVEQIIALHPDKLLNKVAIILKLFYDIDLLEENVILDWAVKVSKKYVSKEVAQKIHDKAAPFIKWLIEAEEDESDVENVEIEFNDRVQVNLLKNIVEDDINIDEI